MGLIQRGCRFLTGLHRYGIANVAEGQKIKFHYLKYSYNPVKKSSYQERRLHSVEKKNRISFLVLALGEENKNTRSSIEQQRLKPNRVIWEKDLFNVKNILADATEDYVLILPAGDEIHETYLSCVALWLSDPKVGMPRLIYTDSSDANGNYYFKSHYAPDSLDSQNYIGEIFLLRTKDAVGQLEFTSDDLHYELHQFLLRFTRDIKEDLKKEKEVLHITSPLDLYRKFPLEIREYQYELKENPKVSILIPNKDNVDILKQCLDSILNVSTYQNFEIIIIENNSEEKETFDFYDSLEDERIQVVTCVTDWNYSYINNYGLSYTTGEYILFLNNDTKVITPDWIEQMLYFAMRKDVGAVGVKLLYPDNTIQHGGVTLGIRGVAGHAFLGAGEEDCGYMNRLITVQNLSAVTAACMMVRRDVIEQVNGFDENFKVAFNDVDLCLRIREAGYRIVYNPHAKLYHYESKSRGTDENNPEKRKRFDGECIMFGKRWYQKLMAIDPYYNRNLSMFDDDFSYADIYR